MTISDAAWRSWLLRDSALRTVLCELDYRYEESGGAEVGTLYLADRPYVDEAVPRPYVDCIRVAPTYTRTLTGDRLNAFTASFGTFELDNSDGGIDGWLHLPIDGSEVRFYAGDASWPREDFRHIFTCLAQKMSVPAGDRGRVVVSLRDLGALLNKSIGGEIRLGGQGPSADRWRPVPFGYVHQAPAYLHEEASLTYVQADRPGLLIDDPGTFESTVRDRGVPVDANPTDDGFQLVAMPDGEITSDLLACPDGHGGHRCVSDALRHFVGDRAGLEDLDLFEGPHPSYEERPDDGIADWLLEGGEDYLIGLILLDKTNLIQLLDDITKSGLCSWASTRLNKFTYLRLRPSNIESLGLTPAREITEDDIDAGSLSVDHVLPTYWRMHCRVNRNWTIVQDLADVLTPDEQDALRRPGLEVAQVPLAGDGYLANPQNYHLTMAESPVEDTLLSDGGDDGFAVDFAQRWMDTRRGQLHPPLQTISLRTGLDRYELELGDDQPIRISQKPTLGLHGGPHTQVVGITIDLQNWKTGLQLFRQVTPPEGEPPVDGPDPDPGPDGPGLAQRLVVQQCELNPVPCVLTAPGAFCPLEINCGPDEGGEEPPEDTYGTVNSTRNQLVIWDPAYSVNPFNETYPASGLKAMWDSDLASDGDNTCLFFCRYQLAASGPNPVTFRLSAVQHIGHEGEMDVAGAYLPGSASTRLETISGAGVSGVKVNGVSLTLANLNSFPEVGSADEATLAEALFCNNDGGAPIDASGSGWEALGVVEITVAPNSVVQLEVFGATSVAVVPYTGDGYNIYGASLTEKLQTASPIWYAEPVAPAIGTTMTSSWVSPYASWFYEPGLSLPSPSFSAPSIGDVAFVDGSSSPPNVCWSMYDGMGVSFNPGSGHTAALADGIKGTLSFSTSGDPREDDFSVTSFFDEGSGTLGLVLHISGANAPYSGMQVFIQPTYYATHPTPVEQILGPSYPSATVDFF